MRHRFKKVRTTNVVLTTTRNAASDEGPLIRNQFQLETYHVNVPKEVKAHAGPLESNHGHDGYDVQLSQHIQTQLTVSNFEIVAACLPASSPPSLHPTASYPILLSPFEPHFLPSQYIDSQFRNCRPMPTIAITKHDPLIPFNFLLPISRNTRTPRPPPCYLSSNLIAIPLSIHKQ